MLRDVLKAVADGNLGNALTRLWVLAEGCEDGSQRLSRWLNDWNHNAHEGRVRAYVAALASYQGQLPDDAAEHPLALIEALDASHAERRSLAVVAEGAAPELEIGERRYHLLRRIVDGAAKPAAEARSPNLEEWFRHFRVVPDRVELGGASVEIRLEFLGRIARTPPPVDAGLRLRISHFTDPTVLALDVHEGNLSFLVTGANPAEIREQSLKAEVQTVRDAAAHLWLAPELTISIGLRSQVERWLATDPAADLLLCVPGSCHEDDGGGRVNRAIVLNGSGQRKARQDKCSQFCFPAQVGELHEGIAAARRLILLVTPIGTVGVAICKDYFDGTADGLIRAAWDRLAPDWMLVPSMGHGDTRAAHDRRAKENWELRRTRTLVANQEPRMPGESPEPVPGFVRRGAMVETVAPGGSSLAPRDDDPPLSAGRRPRLTRIK